MELIELCVGEGKVKALIAQPSIGRDSPVSYTML
jgi:hypothetical protein